MTIETSELNRMRDAFALASEDGQRINSSDSNVFVIVVTDKRKSELLNLLEARFDGKEKRIDECVEKCFIDGLTAQLRSVEYSRKTKRNAEIAELAREHKGSSDDLIAAIRKIEERDK